MGGLSWTLEGISSWKGWLSIVKDCQKMLWSHYPWKYLEDVGMALRDIIYGGLGSIRLMIGHNDLKGLFQHKYFCDSTINQRQESLNQMFALC